MVNVAVFYLAHPLQVVNIVNLLDEHRDPFETVCELRGHDIHVQRTHLLEVGELCDLHTVKPDLPAKPPGAGRRVFPVVLDKADIMLRRIDTEHLQAFDIHLLDVVGRRLDDDLILVIMLKPVGVFSISSVCWSSGRFNVSYAPGLGTENTQCRSGIHRTGADFQVVRLLDDATLRSPKMLKAHNYLLKIHLLLPPLMSAALLYLNYFSAYC